MFNGDIFKMEFKRTVKSLLIWSFSLGLYMLLIVVLYPMVKDIYETMPAEMLQYMEMFGGLPTNIIDYYATEGATMMQLVGVIFATLLGFSMLRRDERELTADVIYTLPVSRKTFFYTKFILLIVEIVLFVAIVTLISFAGIIIIERTVSFASFIWFNLLNLLLVLIMGILGFGFAAVTKGSVKSAVALLIPLPLYILTFISQLTANKVLEKLKYLSAFTFADPFAIINNGGKIAVYTLISYLVLAFVATLFGNYKFQKKEFFQ